MGVLRLLRNRSALPGSGLIVASMWSLVVRGGGMLASFVLGIQLARYLGPAELGTYGVVVAIALLLSAVAQLGLPTLATREVALASSRRDYPRLRGVVRWFGLVSLAAALVLAACFAAVSYWGPTRLGLSGVVGSALVPLFALTVLVSAELRALGRLVGGQSLEIFVRPVAHSILCLALFLSSGAFGAFSALVLAAAAAAFALALGMLWLRAELPAEARSAKPRHDLHNWLKSAAPLAITDVVRQLDGVYALLLLGVMTTAAETGIFRVALSSMMLFAAPLFVVQVVVAPSLARLYESGEHGRLQSLVAVAALVNTLAGLAGLIIVALGGPGLVTFIFGAEYADAFMPLLILCLSQVVSGLFGVGFVLLPMAGRERELRASFLASVGTSLLLAIPLIQLWGATGAAAAAVFGWTVNGLVVRHFARRELGIETTPLGVVVRA